MKEKKHSKPAEKEPEALKDISSSSKLEDDIVDSINQGNAEPEESDEIETKSNSEDDIETELNVAKDKILRMAAEMENIRKRSLKEKEDAIKYSITKFSRDIITVADDLERAIESTKDKKQKSEDLAKNLIDGIDITIRSLKQILSRNGIERFDPLGDKFDPMQHEAMFEVPDENAESGIVVHLVEPGYRINDRILRPARVGVSKSSAKDK
tara:strand:+ start:86879 stop:87511 length:633 start_codon:yes stop_codon:yes gene_type:complete